MIGAAIRNARHDRGLVGRAGRSAKSRHTRAPRTPRPYPIAALMPQTTPWNAPGRGTSEGVNDRQAKATATQAPGRVYRNRRRGCRPGSAWSVGLVAVAGFPGSEVSGAGSWGSWGSWGFWGSWT